jgi:hypothetical protein
MRQSSSYCAMGVKYINPIKKASEAEKSEDAMRFSQAALNAANALVAMFLNLHAK